jgi:D-galactonate transporter
MDNIVELSSTVTASTASVEKPTRARYFMLSLVLIATVISYVDRMNLSIAAPFMSKDLGIDKVHMGYMFSAFAWTYAFALIPGGYLADRFGSRVAYTGSLALWSLATAAQGLVGGFGSLFGARLAVGAMEAPAFPSNARAVTMWFPARERGLATGIYVMGQYIGTAIFSGLLLWMAVTLGWRTLFFATGATGVVFAIIWYFLYRDPLDSKRANASEIAYIRAGGGEVAKQKKASFSFAAVLLLLRYRQIWAICIGKFASFAALTFFLTWFPTYLIEQRHMHMLKAGFFLVLPYVGASVGILIAGSVSDLLIRRGVSLSFARKAPLVIGSLLGTSIVFANLVTSDTACIAILTTAFFAQGFSSMSWAAVSEVAPVQYIGLTSGVTSLSANLAGIVVPIVIGYIVHVTGSFVYALDFVGMLSVIGALSYSLLLGRLHRIVIDEPAA